MPNVRNMLQILQMRHSLFSEVFAVSADGSAGYAAAITKATLLQWLLQKRSLVVNRRNPHP